MENASKALIIAGAILISILIIAIGMYIYSSSTGSIQGAIGQMSTQEIDAANAQWTNFEGTQSGTQVKALITKLIANADSFQDEQQKVVGLDIAGQPGFAGAADAVYDGDPANVGNFTTILSGIQNEIKAKHNYTVELDYEGTSLIRKIHVTW